MKPESVWKFFGVGVINVFNSCANFLLEGCLFYTFRDSCLYNPKKWANCTDSLFCRKCDSYIDFSWWKLVAYLCLFGLRWQVVTPKEWCARRGSYNDIDLVIPAPLVQTVTGTQGHYQQINSQSPALHVKEFESMALSRKWETSLVWNIS